MFDATHYEVRQKFGIRTRYTVYEGDAGSPILTAKEKKKKLRLKEDFRFTTPDGEEAFRVKADSVLDIAAAYDIVDSRTNESGASNARSHRCSDTSTPRSTPMGTLSHSSARTAT